MTTTVVFCCLIKAQSNILGHTAAEEKILVFCNCLLSLADQQQAADSRRIPQGEARDATAFSHSVISEE